MRKRYQKNTFIFHFINKYFIAWVSLLFFISGSIYGQIIKLKPGPAYGEDAEILTSYGCVIRGGTIPWESMNMGTSDLDYSQWTYSALSCGIGTGRALIRFRGLDTISTTRTLISAKLNFFGVPTSGTWGTSYFPGSPYTATNEGWVQRVTGSWNESTVTWNTQPTSTTVNRVAISPSAARFGWGTSLDVTTLVNDIKSSGVNNGFLLLLNTEAYYRRVIFASSDNTDSTLWPELVLTYDIPVPPYTCSLVPNFKDTEYSCLRYQFTDLSTTGDTSALSWKWDFGDGHTSTLQNPAHTYVSYGNYTVKLVVKNNMGCIDSISKVIHADYTHFANAGKDTSLLCASAIMLHASGGVSYAWSPVSGLSNPFIANPIATISSNTSYVVTVVDSIGCVDQDTVNIDVKSGTIKVVATPASISGCAGDKVQLNATGAMDYQWMPPVGLDSNNIANPILSIAGTMRYMVTGTDSNGCIGQDSIQVTQFPTPHIKAVSDGTVADCINENTIVTATGGVSYTWAPAFYCDNSDAPSTKVHPPNTTVFTVKGVSVDGCIGTDTVTVFYKSLALVKVPNAFTPNDDQINDIIRPVIVCGFTLTEFSIYNRWGERIFTTNNATYGWDGKANGTLCDIGVYYYILRGRNSKNEDLFFTGDITLAR